MKRRTKRPGPKRGALLLGLLLAACGGDGGGHGDDSKLDGGPDTGSTDDLHTDAGGAAFPSTEQLCTLDPSTSNEADLREVFGEPAQVQDGPSKVLHYRFEDQTEWLFFIDGNGAWSGYTVQNEGSGEASVPECWIPDGGFWERPDGGYWQRPDGGNWQRPDGGWR